MSCLRLFFKPNWNLFEKCSRSALFIDWFVCVCACEEYSNRWNISQTIHNLTFEGYKSKHVITRRKWKKIYEKTQKYLQPEEIPFI